MVKRKALWLLLLSAGILRLGIECFPEPDLDVDLLNLGNLLG